MTMLPMVVRIAFEGHRSPDGSTEVVITGAVMGSSTRALSKKSNLSSVFSEKFSLWLRFTAQLDAPYPSNVDAFDHEIAMDAVYDQRKPIELWLSHHIPSSSCEAFCLLEMIRRDDEDMSPCVISALRNTQAWLAQGLLSNFEVPTNSTSEWLADRTLRVTDGF